MFDNQFRSQAEQKLRPIGSNLQKLGVTANHLTVLGVLMAGGAAVAIGAGALRLGLVLVVLTALPDVLDGAVAKASGTASPRGAFFDSVCDRLTDALMLGGVAWYLAGNHPGRIAVLPMAVLGASMLISYERAKAESLSFDAKGGLMERAERIVALCFGLLFNQLLIAVLWAMLALTLLTAVQRFVKVWRQAGAPLAAPSAPAPLRPSRVRASRTARAKARRPRTTERRWQRPSRLPRR